MIAQIYGITSLQEAIACAKAGADHIGIVPPIEGQLLPGTVDDKTVTDILSALKGKCKVILLSESEDANTYLYMAQKYHPDIIHIAAKHFASNREFYNQIKQIDPRIQIMQCVPVGIDQNTAVQLAVSRAQYADFLITDSLREGGAVGAAGITHSHETDTKIVQAVNIPVILAGGLECKNAQDVINAVHPAGLDSLTKTNLPGTHQKDILAVAQFCKICHSC